MTVSHWQLAVCFLFVGVDGGFEAIATNWLTQAPLGITQRAESGAPGLALALAAGPVLHISYCVFAASHHECACLSCACGCDVVFVKGSPHTQLICCWAGNGSAVTFLAMWAQRRLFICDASIKERSPKSTVTLRIAASRVDTPAAAPAAGSAGELVGRASVLAGSRCSAGWRLVGCRPTRGGKLAWLATD